MCLELVLRSKCMIEHQKTKISGFRNAINALENLLDCHHFFACNILICNRLFACDRVSLIFRLESACCKS